MSLVTAFAFTSCGGDSDTTQKDNEQKETAQQTEDTSKNTESDIALVNYENQKIGFSILVPKEGKVLADNEYGFTNSQVLPGGMHEINVSVNPATGNVNSVEDFKKDLHNMMARDIIKAEKTETGFMAINKEKIGSLITVYHRVGKVQAKISVPKKFQQVAEKIAASIKSSK